MAILISDKADVKARKITSDREVHYIITKKSTYQEDTVILNMIYQTTELQNMQSKS